MNYRYSRKFSRRRSARRSSLCAVLTLLSEDLPEQNSGMYAASSRHGACSGSTLHHFFFKQKRRSRHGSYFRLYQNSTKVHTQIRQQMVYAHKLPSKRNSPLCSVPSFAPSTIFLSSSSWNGTKSGAMVRSGAMKLTLRFLQVRCSSEFWS